MAKDISVIIINFNSSKYTVDCIKSILKHTSTVIHYEIIVVDNASNNEDYEHLKKSIDKINFIHLKLIRSKINTGFGGGNMLGVQFAEGSIYAFINNDTLLQNDCLDITQNFLNKSESVSICSPQQYNENGEVQKSFDHFLTFKREFLGRKILEKSNPELYPKRKQVYDQPTKVQSIPGSFMVVKADSFHQVGGFDTTIFLYYEETDLCYRIAKDLPQGDCYLVPKAKYTHFKGKSTSTNPEIKKELKLSLLYVLRKHSGYLAYQFVRWQLTLKFLFKSLLKPKYFDFFIFFLKGAPLHESLKQKQTITN